MPANVRHARPPEGHALSLPPQNPNVRPHQLDYERVITRDVSYFFDVIENARVKVKAFFSFFEADEATLEAAAEGLVWDCDGFERCKLRLPAWANRPCLLIL